MNFKTLLPTGILTNEDVLRVRIDTRNGSMTFLPNHADFVTALTSGVVSFVPANGENQGKEIYMACDQGILVKEGNEISLSVRRAIIGEDLEVLTKSISTEFKKVEEERKTANTAMARLEVGLTRGILKLNKGG